jgi:hypothetical protein
MKTREQLATLLQALEDRLPSLLEQCPRAERLGIFAYEASSISDVAGPEDWAYVRLRIDALIEKYGLDRSYRTFATLDDRRVAA